MPSKFTKRTLLAEISKCFNALGSVSLLTIRGKLLIQEAWKCKSAWDEALPKEFIKKWVELIGDYVQIPMLEFPSNVASQIPGEGFGGQFPLGPVCDQASVDQGLINQVLTAGSM